ncbi:MAG TPA: type II toxin-antitoxin system MqsA family antitoxin [Rhodanobacteraceae bacterium]
MSTRFCAECGSKELTRFSGEAVPLHDGTLVAGLSGVRCTACGEVYLDEVSHARYAAAGDARVLARRDEDRAMLVRVRKKLKLTQQQAAELTGGGHNAFSRYERGEARPMPAVVNLFRLLDRHPNLLKDVHR